MNYLIPIVGAVLLTLAALQARRTLYRADQRLLFYAIWGLILLLFLGYVVFTVFSINSLLQFAPAQAADMGLDESALARGTNAIIIAVAAAGFLWWWMTSERLREKVSFLFPKSRAKNRADSEPVPSEASEIDFVFEPPSLAAQAPSSLSLPSTRSWSEQIRGFDPQSLIHALAVGMILLLFLQTILDYFIVGGLAGLATELTETEVVVSSILTAIALLAVSFLGVGVGYDRSWREVLDRLGLRLPTLNEMIAGIGAGVLLFAFQACAGMVWMAFTPENVFQEQTQLSQAIGQSVTTLVGAFLLALFSSVGEEISFRGALQPVIGLWPTTILFALTHSQYQFTPAALIILIVGLVLGLIRRHFGTVAAIIGHFSYNFTILALALLASQLPGT